ncbi:MAG: aldose 1-epimerase [Acidobacteriota bacterium]
MNDQAVPDGRSFEGVAPPGASTGPEQERSVRNTLAVLGSTLLIAVAALPAPQTSHAAGLAGESGPVMVAAGAGILAAGAPPDRQAVAAAPYSARREGDVVRLHDSRHQTGVAIATSVGNIAFELTVKGHSILRWPYASVEDFKSRPALSGIPFVGPWANRLDEPAFYANGRKYALDMDLGNVRGGAIPIHGFLSTTDRWQIIDLQADATAAWLTSRLEFHREPTWIAQWPFAHIVEMTYRLQGGVLEVQTTIRNLSSEPMPVAIGYHPYFTLTDSPRDQWTLAVAARTRWPLAPTKLPTGETEPIERLFPNPRSIALDDYNLDDVFSDLVRDAEGRSTMSVAGRSQRVEVIMGPRFRSVVVWAPHPADRGRGSQGLSPSGQAARGGTAQDRNFICIEPMAGITNGINLAHKGVYRDLQSVPAGGTWRESFWVKPSGF